MGRDKRSRATTRKGGQATDTTNIGACWSELPHELLASIASYTCPPQDPVPTTYLGSAAFPDASLSCASRRHAQAATQIHNCPTTQTNITQSAQQVEPGSPGNSGSTAPSSIPPSSNNRRTISWPSPPTGTFQPAYMSTTARAMRCVCREWCEVLSEGVLTVKVQQPQPLSLWPTHFPFLASLDLSSCPNVNVQRTDPTSASPSRHTQGRRTRDVEQRSIIKDYQARSLADLTSLRTLSCLNSSPHMELASSCSELEDLHVFANIPDFGDPSVRGSTLFAFTHAVNNNGIGRSGLSTLKPPSSPLRTCGRRSGLDLALGRLPQLRRIHLSGVDASPGRLGCTLMRLSALSSLQLHACELPTFFGPPFGARSGGRSFGAQLVADLGSKLRDLSLQNCELMQLHEDILAGLTGLRLLDLSVNKLTTLPRSITRLTALEHLDVQFNSLRALPNGLPALSRLVDLDLASNLLTRLPPDFKDLTSLTLLSLNGLVSLNAAAALPLLAPLTNLVALDLNEMDLSFDPFEAMDLADVFMDEDEAEAVFGPFAAAGPHGGPHVVPFPEPAAAEMVGGGGGGGALPPAARVTELSELLAALAPAGRLRELVLNGCGLELLPARITELTALSHLSISGNELTECPPFLSALTNLVVLRLSRLHLEEPLQPGFFNLVTGLRELDLQETFMPLSHDISKLTNLQVLDLQGALWSSYGTSELLLWTSIYALKRLSALAASGSVSSYPMPPGISALSALQVLLLHDVLLPSEVLGELCRSARDLQRLSLTGCGITKVPNHITRLGRLRELLLDANALCRLPPGLDKLPRLINLGLRDNKELHRLPSNITRLSNLQRIAWTLYKSSKLTRELMIWLAKIPELALDGTAVDLPSMAKKFGVAWPKGVIIH